MLAAYNLMHAILFILFSLIGLYMAAPVGQALLHSYFLASVSTQATRRRICLRRTYCPFI